MRLVVSENSEKEGLKKHLTDKNSWCWEMSEHLQVGEGHYLNPLFFFFLLVVKNWLLLRTTCRINVVL